ncbi:MAG: uncharacterized protein A8A55_1897 [Amphiamblys sp. WSBS2006]|nr:MAG: uncharacterized protein A8A55_1897 [Amphiamblys sp. WSBS2006]
MKLVLFVSVFLGYAAAVEDASGGSGDGKSMDQGAVLSEGLRGGGGLQGRHYADGLSREIAENEDETFDILEKIKKGEYSGKKLKKISSCVPSPRGVGNHIFGFKKKMTPMRV